MAEQPGTTDLYIEETEAKLRKWLTIARPAWSYPLEKDEAAALIAEIDRLRGSLELAGEGDGAL